MPYWKLKSDLHFNVQRSISLASYLYALVYNRVFDWPSVEKAPKRKLKSKPRKATTCYDKHGIT